MQSPPQQGIGRQLLLTASAVQFLVTSVQGGSGFVFCTHTSSLFHPSPGVLPEDTPLYSVADSSGASRMTFSVFSCCLEMNKGTPSPSHPWVCVLSPLHL